MVLPYIECATRALIKRGVFIFSRCPFFHDPQKLRPLQQIKFHAARGLDQWDPDLLECFLNFGSKSLWLQPDHARDSWAYQLIWWCCPTAPWQQWKVRMWSASLTYDCCEHFVLLGGLCQKLWPWPTTVDSSSTSQFLALSSLQNTRYSEKSVRSTGHAKANRLIS